MAMREMQDWI